MPGIVSPLFFLPKEYIKLGCFIKQLDQPHQGLHDPPYTSQPPEVISTFVNYRTEQQVASSTLFQSKFTSFISAAFSRRTNIKINVTSDTMKKYTLNNFDGWFDKATSLPETREWIERAINSNKRIYMIVALHTITDAKISYQSSAGKSTGGQLEVPLTEFLSAAGIVLPSGNDLALNPGLKIQVKDSGGEKSHFTLAGEQVCALQYRQLEYGWLSSKTLNNARLSDVRQWPMMEISRDENDGVDDVIKVGLKELETPGEGWEKEMAEDAMLFFPSI